MKQAKRKLQLDRLTIRPLDAGKLTRVAGGGGGDGTDLQNGPVDSNGCSVTQNYSNKTQLCW